MSDSNAARTCRDYPAELEAWWVERAKRAADTASVEAALARVVPVAAAVSDRFTTDRPEHFRDYHDEETLLAYGLFFFPQSWCRTRFALAEATFRGWRIPAGRPLRVLDLGAGTGAAGLSAVALAPPGVEIDAVDRSPLALGALSALASATQGGAGTVRVKRHVADLRAPLPPAVRGSYDLILVSFAINEAFVAEEDDPAVAWLLDLCERLAPEGLLVILEPALRTTSLRLRRIAAASLERAAGAIHAWGPQLHDGPWRPREDGRFWPHEVRRWRLPKSVEFINRTLKRSLQELAFSFAAFGKSAPEPIDPEARIFRLTSPIAEAKGRLVWTGLAADGVDRPYEGLTRSLSGEDAARIDAFERGDILEADAVAPIGQIGAMRVATLSALRAKFHPE